MFLQRVPKFNPDSEDVNDKSYRSSFFFARQHSNTRTTCSYYFILKYLKPRMAGKAPDDEYVAEASKKQMDDTLNTIEKLWLHEDKPFMGGSNEVSIADLFGACEIEQPRKIHIVHFMRVLSNSFSVM